MAALGQATQEELLLYRVLQRANLTQYYETFIQQGGDDIRQLCEAGEEEFLEIMALVGMAAKPLHVRRLQKALQEWITQPEMFEKPIGPCTPPPAIASGSIVASVGRPQQPHHVPSTHTISPGGQGGGMTGMGSGGSSMSGGVMMRSSTPTRSDSNPTPPQGWIPNPDSRSSSPNPSAGPITIEPITSTPLSQVVMAADMNGHHSTLPMFISEPAPMWKAPMLMSNGSNGTLDLSRSSISPTPSNSSDCNMYIINTSQILIPTLTEQQQLAIEAACERLARDLPKYEPKGLNMKNKVNKEIIELMNMADDEPEKITLLRKYSAIYGRFDSKRKNDSKMSLHEVSVNEASAQLCKRIPALLTRREDLYPLSRRAVRDSGYQYSKGHSRANASMEIPPNKKPRIEKENAKKSLTFIPALHEARIVEINKEIDDIIKHQEEIKSKMSEARSKNDIILLELLRHDLEKCASRQLQLRMEQSSMVGSGRNKTQVKVESENNTKTYSDSDSTHEEDTENDPNRLPTVLDLSDNSKPFTLIDGQGCEDDDVLVVQESLINTDIVPTAAHTGKGTKESLLEQGLRMCQEYGMQDLAQQMKFMNNGSAYDSEVDEQEEWNREVERDLEKLKQSPVKTSPDDVSTSHKLSGCSSSKKDTNSGSSVESCNENSNSSSHSSVSKTQACDSTSVSLASGKEVAIGLVSTSTQDDA